MPKTNPDNPAVCDIFAAPVRLSDRPLSLFSTPRSLSIGIHAMLLVLVLIPWKPAPAPRPQLVATSVVLYGPSTFKLLQPAIAGRTGGGGGGGKRDTRPASYGRIPRPAEKQFVPPDPEPPKNPDPVLIMEPTVVAPQLAQLPQIALLPIGDSDGIPGPASSGSGEGGGIGNRGKGRGDGEGEGPGVHDGKNGGVGGGTPAFGGAGHITPPTIVYRVEPEYSEEARKARFQGTVLLKAIVRKDGQVDVLNVVRSLGLGLDQNAMEALKQWRFRPGTQDGTAVDVPMNIEVTFNLR